MSNFSDHTKPQTDIVSFIPEVYRSDVNQYVFENTFNKHLTKDDTVHVSGFVGQGNSQAIVNRQIKENTVHRQTYQLAPTMYSKVGTHEQSLSFAAFLEQLRLMGVNIDRFDKWGSTTSFNWIPPVNIDMLVNYADYFWTDNATQTSAQYITIENKCSKAQSKVKSYKNILDQRGSEFAVSQINFKQNQFVISGKYDDLFVFGFLFFISTSSNANLARKYWTTQTSSFDSATNTTIITVIEPIITVSSTAPANPTVGLWWYDASYNVIKTWSGTEWVATSSAILATISLAELATIFETTANCACNQDYGWDIGLWDDNQVGSTIWNEQLMSCISHSSEEEWIRANNNTGCSTVGSTSSTPRPAPQALDIWYDLSTDTFKQRDLTNTSWVVIYQNFSSIVSQVTGNFKWDFNTSCATDDVSNQWISQNKWIHKSEVTSFSGIKRAELPILEFNSNIEMNKWNKTEYSWLYRSEVGDDFAPTSSSPSRFELEPIMGFSAQHKSDGWYLFLFDKSISTTADIDFTSTFVPGYQFRIVDDNLRSDVYTVSYSEYRASNSSTDPVSVRGNYFITVIKLVEPVYVSPLSGGDAANTRIEPQITSNGDTWRGYHAHWVFDASSVSIAPCSDQQINIHTTIDQSTSNYTTISVDAGILEVGTTYQELTVQQPSVTQVQLHDTFLFNDTVTSNYVFPSDSTVRVYINSIRQYGNYTFNTSKSQTKVMVGHALWDNNTFEYVTGVTFKDPVLKNSIIRIEVGAASLYDAGMFNIPVRTSTDETVFSENVALGVEPAVISLVKFCKGEQVKTSVNQYPIFNVYDLVTGNVLDTNQLFSYNEDPSSPININVQRRIVVDTTSTNVQFKQWLVDGDNGTMYGYRNGKSLSTMDDQTLMPRTWWYNTITNQCYGWVNDCWDSSIITRVSSGTIVKRNIIVSKQDPSVYHSLDSALWYNTNDGILYTRNVVGSKWDVLSTSVVTGADPSLFTIWRHNDSVTYAPKYIDVNKQEVPVGSTSGDWQLPDQWIYNPDHENHSLVMLDELSTHLSSVITNQQPIPGLLNGGRFSITQDNYNYGIGGTIKEYNDNFDLLISAVNLNNTTPVRVIEFAQSEYASNIESITNIFSKNIISYAIDPTTESNANFTDYITNQVINSYEDNEFTAQLYNDTSAYDSVTKTGVKNWIATAPMFGLAPCITPYVLYGDSFTEVRHHDGHRTRLSISTALLDRYARIICNSADSRSVLGTFGVISNNLPPSTVAQYLQQFSTQTSEIRKSLLPGVYWYNTVSRTLYRFQCVFVGDTLPTNAIDGVELPDGAKCFNITTNLAYVKQGSQWLVLSTSESDISSMWEVVDFTKLVASTVLKIEQSLYDIASTKTGAFDYTSLITDSNDQSEYDQIYETRFNQYVSTHNIKTPLVNDDYVVTNAFTWNYADCVYDTQPTTNITNIKQKSCWQALYNMWYGTPYPHLEPWCLQGFISKPDWWDAQYQDTTNVRRWKYNHSTKTGMWENIRTGQIPAGCYYPNGTISTGSSIADGIHIPTYSYFSVNISDNIIAGGYKPDALLPPYYNNSDIELTNPTVRSLFVNFSSQIVNASADYIFGNASPVEWNWITSSQYVYDKPVIAFLMQPVKFLHGAFGTDWVNVDKLQIDKTFKKVYSHVDTLFHGDIYNTNLTYVANGLNQWYVNFNRYSGYDVNTEFRELWVNWIPKLTYQFDSIVDLESFNISTKYFDINSQDYNVLLVNNGTISDSWIDAFEVSVLSMPPSIVQYNNQNLWKFELDTLASTARTLQYYAAKTYVASVDHTTDVLSVNRFVILDVDKQNNRIGIAGNQLNVILPTKDITITDSSANNGQYQVATVTYEPSNDMTMIGLTTIIPSSSVDGNVFVSVDDVFGTGDLIVVNSTTTLPSPIVANTAYYIIALGNNQYKLADTYSDALESISIDIVTGTSGTVTLSQIDTTFKNFGGSSVSQDLWFHFKLDKTVVHTLVPPITIRGMQSLITILDGYVAYQKDNNIVYGATDIGEFDPETGRVVDWQLETERFIDWAYRMRNSQFVINDRYAVSVTPSANEFQFLDGVPVWPDGTKIVFSNTSGVIPLPLIANTPYYVYGMNNETNTFKVSVTPYVVDESIDVVDITTTGTGTLYVSLYASKNIYPSFEINPCRNSIVLSTPIGMLADVIEGPYSDIRVQQTIFDQYSRPIHSDNLIAFRYDKRSHISIRPAIANDVNTGYVDDPYNYIHFGGAHLFVEGYEHFLIFNNYTASSDLIYDPFLGLYTKKFNLDFNKTANYTLRPAIGGFYLSNGEFKRNIEGSLTDLNMAYDSTKQLENGTSTKLARKLIGYKGNEDFLDLLNINSTSQFMFYRGMLQSKGSANSVTAYINSRRFVDAKMDEYWAWKIAEFGDNHDILYPQIKLKMEDSLKDDVRLLFLSPYETVDTTDYADDIAKGFQEVSFSSPDRWVDFPEQRDTIESPLFLDAEISSMEVVYINTIPPSANEVQMAGIQYWYDGTTLNQFVSGEWVVITGKIRNVNNSLYWLNDTFSDTVRVIRRNVESTLIDYNVISANTNTVVISQSIIDKFDVGDYFQITNTDSTVTTYKITSMTSDGNSTTLGVTPNVVGNHGTIASFSLRNFSNYTTTTMLEGTGVDEFTRVNSSITKFTTTAFNSVVMIFTLNASASRISPAKLVDTKSHTALESVPLWHPARNLHYDIAIHNVDQQSAVDPATYAYTLDPSHTSTAPWNNVKSGTVWLDTTNMSYVPYYDNVIFPNVNERLYKWGNLADWGNISVYKWVNTTTAPSDWDSQVLSDATNKAIPQQDKATGTPRKMVFKRTRLSYTGTVDITNNVVVSNIPVSVNDVVLFSTSGTLPTPLIAGIKYTVSAVSSNNITIVDDTNEIVTFSDTGNGTLTIVPEFKSADWVAQTVYREKIYAAITLPIVTTLTEPTIPLSNSNWVAGDLVNVYINGTLSQSNMTVGQLDGHCVVDLTATGITISACDIIDIIRPIHTPTDTELAFDPDSDDDGVTLVQWTSDYEYTINTVTSGNLTTGTTTTTYYSYWVENISTVDSTRTNGISPLAVTTQLKSIPIPYFVTQLPNDDTTLIEKYGYGLSAYGMVYSIGDIPDQYYITPVTYREAIIRNVASYITDDDRYVIMFQRNLSLRDKLEPNKIYGQLKNRHTEWYLFRREQTSSIPKALWIKLIESMTGQSYNDASVRVPSLERELYDATYGTDTRYGLGANQSFVDKNLALATVQSYLQNPDNDFYPADIDDFLSRNSFDTPANIRIAMDEIYDTFPAIHVNSIWFETLHDAFSTRSKYKELMKTSWIALHGIRVLEVGGLFDD